MKDFIKETEKVSPTESKVFLENKNISTNTKHTTMTVDTAWKLPEECECLSHDIFTAASTQQTTSRISNKSGKNQQQVWKLLEEFKSHDNFTAASTQQTTSMSSNIWREPPIYPSSVSIQGDREKLNQCITALKLWVRVSEVKQQNQANVVQHSTSIQRDREKLKQCMAALKPWVKISRVKQQNQSNVVQHTASSQEGRGKLNQCITALKLWVKVSGVKQRNQAKVVKNNAYQNSQEYLEELDSKFGDTLNDKEDGVKQVMKYLEEKLKVNQHSEIVKKLNVNLGAEETTHIEERLLKENESEVYIRRNLCSTLNTVIEENKLPAGQIVQGKEKQDRETTNESSTATAINAIIAVEPLDNKIINNNSTTKIPTTISKFDACHDGQYSMFETWGRKIC